MGNPDRFEILLERHIGVGIRWCSDFYQLEISFSIPFITICIRLWKEQ